MRISASKCAVVGRGAQRDAFDDQDFWSDVLVGDQQLEDRAEEIDAEVSMKRDKGGGVGKRQSVFLYHVGLRYVGCLCFRTVLFLLVSRAKLASWRVHMVCVVMEPPSEEIDSMLSGRSVTLATWCDFQDVLSAAFRTAAGCQPTTKLSICPRMTEQQQRFDGIVT